MVLRIGRAVGPPLRAGSATDSVGSAVTSELLEASPPLHDGVYRLIAADIANGVLAPGDRLPAERTLSERLSVSRSTVRRAIQRLVAEGLVEAGVGRGSFVTAGPIGEAPNALMGFTELGRSRRLEPTARVLEQASRSSTVEEADAFGIAPGAELFELRRVRYLDGVPVAVDHNRVPLSCDPGLPALDFTRESLYEALTRAGSGPVRADYAVRAEGAEEQHARHLGLRPGEPVLVATTHSYEAGGRLVELGRTVYRGDRYWFRATLTRKRHHS
jgi:GntR family transcriptional regulator